LRMLLGPVASIAGNWMDGKVEETKAKAAVKVAKAHAEAEVSKRVAAGEIDIQRSQADATDGSWKDEFFSVIFGLWFLGNFAPFLDDYYDHAYQRLNAAPEWLTYTFMSIVAASFGFKSIGALRGKK
jgi:hypothetical protein